MKRPIYLLKNDIDFSLDSKITLISLVSPDTSSILGVINISGTDSEQIIKRLSLDIDNYTDVEYNEDYLTVKIEAKQFLDEVCNSFKQAQYGLDYNMRINLILTSKIKELSGVFPHYIEIEFTRVKRKNVPKVNLSSVLRNVYFDERSEIISNVLCMEKIIVDIITERFQDNKIEIKTKKGVEKKYINKSTLYQKICFLHDQDIIDSALYNLLDTLRKMRNHAAHDLSLTESVYNDSILKLTSKFIDKVEIRYNLNAGKVARFSNCFMYVFDEISSLCLSSDNFSLGRENCDEWNSFFYGV
ncbi:DUF4145 domain-containing protein [Klebsiella pneumoniae]|uniref:DUF4145 domain-containing protein n=1 Tax=Klebsiella pneumoniae TaxID=573 RepID=UPI00220AE08D|nr:DUF4145 domain-containing protein [Klebsiella pneumoniae]MDM8847659.1 DUF4145 domain-containing protein [Klebsiella pneumoniae]BDP20674.1 hypothetical protein TUM9839_31310 [Klebsiella pneumoniae subsp. pneumoniae]